MSQAHPAVLIALAFLLAMAGDSWAQSQHIERANGVQPRKNDACARGDGQQQRPKRGVVPEIWAQWSVVVHARTLDRTARTAQRTLDMTRSNPAHATSKRARSKSDNAPSALASHSPRLRPLIAAS